jgi:hypothetical protein
MAEAKIKEVKDVILCKVIAKNPKLTRLRGDKRMISFGYNHIKFNFQEGVEVELPAGLVDTLKSHITDKIVPTGTGSVKGRNFKRETYNSFEVIIL